MIQRRQWLSMFVLAGLLLLSGAVASAQDATAEATESAPLELSQHYVTPNERVSFDYPEGWVLDLRDTTDYLVDGRLASDESILAKDVRPFGEGLDSGEVVIEISIADTDTLISGMSGIDADSSVEEILQAALEQNRDSGITAGDVTSLEVDGQPAARLDIQPDNGGEGFILLIELGDGVVGGISVGAADGELSQWESTALAVAESITLVSEPDVTPEATAEATSAPVPELTQTINTDNDSLVVSYPEGWVARSNGNTGVYVAPDEDSLALSFGDAVSSGQVEILIQVQSTEDLIHDMQLPLEADASAEKILQGAAKAASATGGIEFAPVTSTTIKDKPAGYTTFTSQEFDGLAWAVEYEPGYVMLIQVIAAPGEAETWKDLTVAIAEATKYPG